MSEVSRQLYPETYDAWHEMIQRCTNPDHPGYADEGGRGVKVCDRWLHSFENFLADIGPCPADRKIKIG
jgi:hypothetical protein